MFYTVGEMAKKIGVAPSTLRYYDKEGLLPFVERSDGGIRMFKEEDFGWLSIIECLKKTGMPIKEIKKFIDWGMQGDSTIEERLELIDRQRDEVLKRIDHLNSTLDTLNYKHWFYETAKKPGTCDYPKNHHDDELPPEILEIKKRLNK
ncbi:MAG: MerR family transcriptional regulator [Clostridia bacterium]|nr:MerR family transcriptional regulator [Clostridia bacterium]